MWPLPLARFAQFESYTGGLPWPDVAADLGGWVCAAWRSAVVLEAAARVQEEALVGWASWVGRADEGREAVGDREAAA